LQISSGTLPARSYLSWCRLPSRRQPYLSNPSD
jgi:hypothetical protein